MLIHFHSVCCLRMYLKIKKKGGGSQEVLNSLRKKSLSHVRLFATLWTVAHQAPLSMGFSRQEYWSGLPFPPPGDLFHPGIEPRSPALQADALLSESPGKIPINSLASFFYPFSKCGRGLGAETGLAWAPVPHPRVLADVTALLQGSWQPLLGTECHCRDQTSHPSTLCLMHFGSPGPLM